MRNEDFGRITRLLAHKTPVKLEFDIRNRIVPEGTTSYNMVGEISGSDKKDEVIMLGRASRFVAFGDGSDRQCDRLRDDDGGRPNSEGDRR